MLSRKVQSLYSLRPSNSTSTVCPLEAHTRVQEKTHTEMSIEALLIVMGRKLDKTQMPIRRRLDKYKLRYIQMMG